MLKLASSQKHSSVRTVDVAPLLDPVLVGLLTRLTIAFPALLVCFLLVTFTRQDVPPRLAFNAPSRALADRCSYISRCTIQDRGRNDGGTFYLTDMRNTHGPNTRRSNIKHPTNVGCFMLFCVYIGLMKSKCISFCIFEVSLPSHPRDRHFWHRNGTTILCDLARV